MFKRRATVAVTQFVVAGFMKTTEWKNVVAKLTQSLRASLLALPRVARSHDRVLADLGEGAGRRGERSARQTAHLATALLCLDLRQSASRNRVGGCLSHVSHVICWS